MKMNKEWHLKHAMPKNPSIDQRIKWHLEHQKIARAGQFPKNSLKR